MEIKAMVYDLGGVVHSRMNSDFRRDFAVKYEVDLAEVEAAWSATRGQFIIGAQNETEFWNSFLDQLQINEANDIIIPKIMNQYRTFCAGNADFIAYLDELKKAFKDNGTKMTFAVASNKGKEMAEYVTKHLDLHEHFDMLIFSHELGAAKPDKGFYAKALEKLGIEAGTCLFVDDQEANCEAAKTAGFQVIKFTNVKELKKEVGDLLKIRVEESK